MFYSAEETEIIRKAESIINQKLPGCDVISSPDAVISYFRFRLVTEQRELFSAIFVDSQNRVLSFDVLFYGSLDRVEVHPRILAQKALECNASGVILAHNHPSGVAHPSQADKLITELVVKALGLLDIRVLDHIIVGGKDTCSFAERGWI